MYVFQITKQREGKFYNLNKSSMFSIYHHHQIVHGIIYIYILVLQTLINHYKWNALSGLHLSIQELQNYLFKSWNWNPVLNLIPTGQQT